MTPSNTGPIINPTKPIPDTVEIATEADSVLFLPAKRKISGTTTESPEPNTPNPIILIKVLVCKIKQ